MPRRIKKGKDGFYHVAGKKFKMLVGSRAQVWHGTAYKTSYSGNALKKKHLKKNKSGKIVSRRMSLTAKRQKRLEKAGYFTQKGRFGWHRKKTPRSRRCRKNGRFVKCTSSKSRK
tara:strand:- start:76 stop:420 length:345 start_codon:yes stop_codon:yes gene_type:complete